MKVLNVSPAADRMWNSFLPLLQSWKMSDCSQSPIMAPDEKCWMRFIKNNIQLDIIEFHNKDFAMSVSWPPYKKVNLNSKIIQNRHVFDVLNTTHLKQVKKIVKGNI